MVIKMKPKNVDLAQVFKALADETRMEIIAMLQDGELCACRILERFSITQPTLSYHMKILADCGLVNCRKDGSWMRYSLKKDAFSAICDWCGHYCDGIDLQPPKDATCKEMGKC